MTSITNPFDAYADTYTPRPVKAKMERAAARKARKADPRQAEQDQLAKHYRAAKRQERDKWLATPAGHVLKEMLVRFKRYGSADAPRMIEQITAANWLREHPDTGFRLFALSQINLRIEAIRRDAGLHDIDDPLPGRPDNAFLAIKKLLKL